MRPEISLLSKGLKFCPTPKELDWSAIKGDGKDFNRRIKCKAYFYEVGGSGGDGQAFKPFKENLLGYQKRLIPQLSYTVL
jgi:hypothetical protein